MVLASLTGVKTPAAAATGRLADSTGCSAGYVPEADPLAMAGVPPSCRPAGLESLTDMAARDGLQGSIASAPLRTVPAGAYANAVQQANRIAANLSSGVANSTGTWTPLGTTPLLQNDPTYGRTFGLGDTKVSGRVSSFAYDPARPGRWFASSSDGGVWMTTNSGGVWQSVGDLLPTQTVGAIAWSAARGGTLIAGTGDNATCFNCVAGLGIFTTTDSGATWHQAAGLPGGPRNDALDGPLVFKIAVDPTDATGNTIYAATSKGLYKSTDGALSFVDVRLPTSPAGDALNCQGQGSIANPDPHCFFANVVTDVVVRGADGPAGAPASSVMAAVGWRAGQKLYSNDSGNPTTFKEAPQNGIYVSTGGSGKSPGDPNTFHYVPPAVAGGFTQTNNTGRTALGIARGVGQNHDVVYALVQSSGALNGCTGSEGLDAATQVCTPVGPNTPEGTILDAMYVTTNFAGGADPTTATWTKVSTATALTLGIPGNNSALGPGSGLSSPYHPGVQSWYNLWVEPDPTLSDGSGAPTRIVFGLEEVWEYNTGVVAGPNPRVIGRYWDNCNGLTVMTGMTCNSTSAITGTTTTTHPDQHAGAFVPDPSGGGVTLLAGNDGGAYKQHINAGDDFQNDTAPGGSPAWGDGIQEGLHTLQPYDVAISGDGTVVAGLQDNGQLKISPDGTQHNTHDGDGFFTAIDPNDSKKFLWTYARASQVAFTKDGGSTWVVNSPTLTGTAIFSPPLEQDPRDGSHLMMGAQSVVETDNSSGDVYSGASTWTTVFDLGTNAISSASNTLSSVDLNGANAYVGFCSNCDLVTGHPPFYNGIATNVGGNSPPQKLTGNGWHFAAANCSDPVAVCPGGKLPDRYITSIRMDPSDANTVYVTLGGYARPWTVPGAQGDTVARIGQGHVFKSTDHGETFHDISGNLPNAITNWTAIHGGQLLVATNLGVYISTNTDGGTYAELGSGLPRAHVQDLAFSPSDPNLMVASNYGRGVYAFRFSAAPTITPTPPLPGTLTAVPPSVEFRGTLFLLAGLGLALVAGLLARRPRRRGLPPPT
ncbi:MAG TPA: hypothetical protein VNV65_09205 [Candidatus Solibacter sp.]|nr:hypothetical protein [Candidatus Solibacter sp.]